jgi:SAM-dependent methyltransferase
LSIEGDWLVSTNHAANRFRIESGIPVLLPLRGGDAGQGTRDHAGGESEPIAEAIRLRRDYVAHNYGPNGPPERLARLRLVTQLLGDRSAHDMSVLEAGAGPAVFGEHIRRITASYVAVDLSLDNLRAGRERLGDVDAVVGDITTLPFRADVFDAVLAIGCLEYIPRMGRAIHELCRVTTPGGFVLASFANRSSPARWWNELVVHRLSRAMYSRRRGGNAAYRRHLSAIRFIDAAFERAGARIELVRYLNPGLIGYPLSGIGRIRSAEERLVERAPMLQRLCSEFVIVARKV